MLNAIIYIVMEHACPGCGYISDRPSRFCRQCGKQLYVESEASSAATRNYEPNRVPPPRQPDTPHYSPGPGMNLGMNEEIQETSRFYQPPIAPYHDFPEKKKSRTGFWILIAILCFIMVSVSVAAIVVFALRPHRQVTIVENDFDRIRELGKIHPPPQPPFPPVGPKNEIPDVFTRYKYPNAQVDHSVSAVGNEIVKLSTDDNVGTVRDFYSKVTGSSPLVRNREEEKEEVVFQASTSPPILIIISPDDDLPGRTQIVLIRSVFQIPR